MQGDGTAQLLCTSVAAQAAVCAILERDFSMHCMPFTVPPTGPAGSAGGRVEEEVGGSSDQQRQQRRWQQQLEERTAAVQELEAARQQLAEEELAPKDVLQTR